MDRPPRRCPGHDLLHEEITIQSEESLLADSVSQGRLSQIRDPDRVARIEAPVTTYAIPAEALAHCRSFFDQSETPR